jgi:hypothetical protein
MLIALFLWAGRSSGFNAPGLPPELVKELPQTPADVQFSYVDPGDDQNAAILIQRGLDAFRDPGPNAANLPLFGTVALPDIGKPVPIPMKAALADFIHGNQASLEWFARASERHASRWPVDLSQGLKTVFPHGGEIRKGYALLETAALYHAELQDGRQAIQDVESLLGLTESLRSEPSLLSQINRVLGVLRSTAALEQLVNRSPIPPEHLDQLASILSRMEQLEACGEAFNRALAAERANALAVLSAPADLLHVLYGPGVRFSPAQKAELTRRCGAPLHPEIELCKQATEAILAARRSGFPKRLEGDIVAYEAATCRTTRQHPALDNLLRGLTGRSTQEAECLAQFRFGLVAISLERFRQAHQSYPVTLAELTPEYLASVPGDPFANQPLRYERFKAGYLLRSVGPDYHKPGVRDSFRAGCLTFRVVTPP